jgi:hypothetical protein
MSLGATRLARHINSTPTAIARTTSFPRTFSRSARARTAGTITAPAWTGPPSKVSSKSSPWAAVPLTNAAPAASSVRGWPIAVQLPLGIARGHAQAGDVDENLLHHFGHRGRRARPLRVPGEDFR